MPALPATHSHDAPLAPGSAGSASASVGSELVVEWIGCSAHAVLRLFPAHDTLLRVVAGAVALDVDGDTELLELGEEARIPAATAYRLTTAAFGEARVIVQRRRVRWALPLGDPA